MLAIVLVITGLVVTSYTLQRLKQHEVEVRR
jgi:hypothetical protein